MGFGSADNQIHVANNTSEKIYVIPTPNKDWAWGDIGFAVATSLVTFGGGSAAAVNTLSKLDKLIKIVKLVLNNPLVKTARYAAIAYKIGSTVKVEIDQDSMKKAEQAKKEILDFVVREGVTINPREYKQVNNEKNYNPLRMISPSGWGGLFGASDATLFITNESLTRFGLFNTNSDWSWIVEPNMVVRAKYGSIWQTSMNDGYYRFSVSDRLIAGQYLQPNESLSSPNRNYDFVYQEDGNAVIYKRDKPSGEKPIWSTDTYNKPAWRTCIQEDGNFVVYSEEGKAVWATNVYGNEEKYHGCNLVMQDDGNLVVYNKDNQAIWASGTNE